MRERELALMHRRLPFFFFFVGAFANAAQELVILVLYVALDSPPQSVRGVH